MTTVSICNECKGKGKYKVYNAYDPNSVEEVFCEYCDGLGTLTEYSNTRRPRKNNDEDTWMN